MNVEIEVSKLADAKSVAEKLAELPKNALIYIAGYAEGCRDRCAVMEPSDLGGGGNG